MSDVTVITMSREQVERLLDEKISAALKEQSGKIEENWAVDRKFLKVNFQWDRRKVERLERDRTFKTGFYWRWEISILPIIRLHSDI